MIEEGLPVVHIVDFNKRFDRVRQLMQQWHEAETKFQRSVAYHGEFRDEVSKSEDATIGIQAMVASLAPSRGEPDAAKNEFLAAAETFFMMGRGER